MLTADNTAVIDAVAVGERVRRRAFHDHLSGGTEVDTQRTDSVCFEATMPTVLRVSEFRFFFYGLEGAEPAHIYVEHGDNVAKFWLEPVSLAQSHGFRAHEINRLRALLIKYRPTFAEAWNAHFGHQD